VARTPGTDGDAVEPEVPDPAGTEPAAGTPAAEESAGAHAA
jgi:hypothetical protein